MFTLSFVNKSSVVSDADLQAFLPDLQAQISNEFKAAWGIDATVTDGGNGWQIILQDEPGPNDPQGALGYHDRDANYGPFGIVFCKFAQDHGIAWTSVASHESLELLADPLINSVCFIDPKGTGRSGILVPQECCDAPENLSYPGSVNGTALSDFVYPQWFVPGFSGQVDHLGKVPGPLKLLSGGYIGYDRVYIASGWKEDIAAFLLEEEEAPIT